MSTPITASGTSAHNLTAAAKPNATPPQASRRPSVSRSPSNTSSAPIRQNRFIQGSSRKVCAAITAYGYTA
ncbi:MAG TPA: hypothetical protein VGS06_02800 [Streptosporangiaceae bacterium]|nr:hypothetical protein [Streptosporangiaceae bacterium]